MNIDELKIHVGYDGKPQQWQYGFNLAVRELSKVIDKLKAESAKHDEEFEEWRKHEELQQRDLDAAKSQVDALCGANEKLKAEVNHWKANHDNQVAKARLLMDRPDLPVERVDAYKLVESLQAELANTHRAFEAYQNETERKYGCYKPSCFAHDSCTCASGHMQKEQCPYFIIGQIKAENEQLKAAAQAVVDAESAITYAIIAPSAEKFDEIVEQRK